MVDSPPYISGQRLNGILGSYHVEKLVHNINASLADSDTRLVEDVPAEHSLVFRVLSYRLSHHLDIERAKLGVFHIVLRRFFKLLLGHRYSSLMLAEGVLLLTHCLGHEHISSREILLVREHYHYLLTVLAAEVDVAVEYLHIRVGLGVVNVKVCPYTYRVEAYLLTERKLFLGSRELLLGFVALKHIKAVGAVASDKVTSAKPAHALIPEVSLFFSPLSLHFFSPYARVLGYAL